MLRSDFLSTGTSPSVYPAPPRFRHSRAPSGIGGPEGEAPPQDAGRAPAPGARTTSMTCRGLWRSQRPISFIDPAVEASNRTTGGWEVGGWGGDVPSMGVGAVQSTALIQHPSEGAAAAAEPPPRAEPPHPACRPPLPKNSGRIGIGIEYGDPGGEGRIGCETARRTRDPNLLFAGMEHRSGGP